MEPSIDAHQKILELECQFVQIHGLIILACQVNKFNVRTTAEFAGVSEKTSRNYFKCFREIAEKEYRFDIL